MDDKEFDKQLQNLIKEVSGLSSDQQKKLRPIVEETRQRHDDIKENVGKANKSLINLRICLKYMIFDLEATRRERDALARQLNDDQRNSD